MINKNSKIFVAGHTGLVGSAIYKKFKEKGYKNIYTVKSKNLDLRDQTKVLKFFKKHKFSGVINAAGKVGGILANKTYKADFIYDNLLIQTNIIHSSFITKVKSLVMLGSSCIYPKKSSTPIKEEHLLSGYLEDTNEPYAISKICAIKMCDSYNFQHKTNFKCLMPPNMYGPGDNYDPETSHFFPSLIRKIFLAQKNKDKSITLWGSGTPKREMMFNEDLAEASIFFLNKKTKHSLINVGTSSEHSILYYAKFLQKKMKYKAKIKYDRKKPDGVKSKILDISLAKKYGWKPKFDLSYGFNLTYKDFIKRYHQNKIK